MPEEIFEVPQPVAEPKPTNWPKIILAAVLGISLLTGAAYTGYWYGTESAKLKTQSSKPPAVSQPTPTPSPEATPTPTVTPEVSPNATGTPPIPTNWETYDRVFADAKYYFRYPLTYEIWDNDPSSGSIYLSVKGTSNYPVYLSINTFSNLYGGNFEEYESGSRRVWLVNNYKKLYPNLDFSQLQFEEINFTNGKSYLKVTNFPEEIGAERGFYFGVQNRVSFLVGDKKLMDYKDILTILSSIEIAREE